MSETLPAALYRTPAESAAPTHDRIAEFILCLPLVGGILLSKIQIPIGTHQINSGILALGAAVAAGLALGRMRLGTKNAIGYVLLISALILLQVISGDFLDMSYKSLALLAVLHAPYAMVMAPGSTRPRIQLVFYQHLAVVVAILGMAQFGAQFVIGTHAAFPLETYLPPSLLNNDYHMQIPLYYGATVYKSNGVFLVEPSLFSQVLCTAVLVELLYFRRLLYLALLAGGIVVAYSGTGLLVLFSVLPIYVILERKFGPLLLALAGLTIVYFIAADALHLDIFVQRVNEVTGGGGTASNESSFYMRYIEGYFVLDQYIFPSLHNLLFGVGAGSYIPWTLKSRVDAWDPSYYKMPFEYGLVGAAFYFAFVLRCIFATSNSIYLKTAMAFQTVIINTPTSIQPIILVLSLVVWPATPQAAAVDPRSGERASGESSILGLRRPSAGQAEARPT